MTLIQTSESWDSFDKKKTKTELFVNLLLMVYTPGEMVIIKKYTLKNSQLEKKKEK